MVPTLGGRRAAVAAGLVLSGIVAAGGPAAAATATATFAVTATVMATCTTAASPLAFGPYTGAQANATTTATVTTRKMTGSGATLNFSLGKDAAQAANWGNTAGTDTVAGTATGSPIAVTIYGRIPAGQFVAPATYTATITATITY